MRIEMTDKTIEFAHKSKIIDFDAHYENNKVVGGFWMLDQLKAFEDLVRSDERKAENEECARLCEKYRDEWHRSGLGRYELMGEGADYLADFILPRSDNA